MGFRCPCGGTLKEVKGSLALRFKCIPCGREYNSEGGRPVAEEIARTAESCAVYHEKAATAYRNMAERVRNGEVLEAL